MTSTQLAPGPNRLASAARASRPSWCPGKGRPDGADTTLVLAASALLIVNSHLEAYYPFSAGWPQTACWAIRCFISCPALVFKVHCRPAGSRFPYFERRLWRLYPAVIISTIVFLELGLYLPNISNPVDYAAFLVWPTPTPTSA